MAQLSLRERLQPALLDRLIDNERLLTTYELTFRREELRRLGISERELSGILTAQGLRSIDDVERSGAVNDAALVRMTFVAAAGNVPLSQLKALVLKPEGAPQGVSLQSFCEIVPRSVVNHATEAGELKSISMRRLREYVCRDLGALLNCASLDAVVDLTAYPHVQESVVNFGMPSLAGRAARSADPLQIAATIEAAIRRFEPRLSAVRVTPEMGQEGNETHVLAFRIEAQLWGQPAPLQLVLRTRIDVDSGSVNVADAGVG
ncbi:MAG TPA: type VI secretion system baseplate subunit TssE [Polyangiaceae bacterium]|jgi:type VI secretion system protein ImpF|nr:type VI secretion system baseplate subunit TssE [Polyangiaceae bacterium]